MTNSCPALILSLALAWAALAVCCYAAHAEANLFVAQDGDDAAPGTEERPLASLEAARDAIRAMKAAGPLPEGGVTVHVRGGTYSLPKTFALDAQDAGTEAAPIVYRAYGDEDVRLSGGQRIEGFHPVSDEAILARIPEEARADVLVAGLREQGITDYGELTPRGFGRPEHPAGLELFFESKPMPLAAWPNEGWATIAGAPDGKDGGRFTYEGDRPARWTQAEDLWIHGYWTYDWADTYVKVASIDPDAKLIVTQEPHGAYGYTPGKRYRALNLIEELDAPGEWYLDRANGLLYFWPPSPIDAGAPTASILTKLVSMKDTDYVTFRGFTFECARATAVTVSGGTHNRIAGCTLRNFGTTAATVSGGTHNGVIACDIYGCDKGMGISGGDRKSLTPCHNFAENNHIHHFGRWCRTYRPGVGVSGVGIRVAHNVIHDGPHNAIQLSGNDNLIEFNEIYAVCGQTGDVGA
ncbi:MAG: right-handed parallel beta-helix repeat-containing protein, partial [Candidatus Hydrogenedentes bacterium]|nr:right-handed parallel beta-helix repeat-containing protein [Candidatus Hydrogenedentota bacterium]